MSLSTARDRALEIGPIVALSSFSAFREMSEVRMRAESAVGDVEDVIIARGGEVPLDEFPRIARDRYGIRMIELCQAQMVNSSVEAVADLASALRDAEVEVLTMPIDLGNIAQPEESRRRRWLDETLGWVDIAHRLGARFVRVNPGAPSGGPNSDRGALISSLHAIIEQAEVRGMGVLVENITPESASVAWMKGIVDEVGEGRLGIVLDTGNFAPMLSVFHAWMAGESVDVDRLDFEGVYENIAELVPFASVVHAKSYDISDDGVFGPVDLRRALGIVRDAGFAGPVTVECEGQGGNTWTNIERTVQLVREVMGR